MDPRRVVCAPYHLHWRLPEHQGFIFAFQTTCDQGCSFSFLSLLSWFPWGEFLKRRSEGNLHKIYQTCSPLHNSWRWIFRGWIGREYGVKRTYPQVDIYRISHDFSTINKCPILRLYDKYSCATQGINVWYYSHFQQLFLSYSITNFMKYNACFFTSIVELFISNSGSPSHLFM